MNIREKLAGSIHQVRDHSRRLAQLNVELLKAELKEKGQKYGAALALFVAAALFAYFGLAFLLATIASAIALALPWWASLLIVAILLLLLGVVLVMIGRRLLQRARTPAPRASIQEAQENLRTVRGGLRGMAGKMRPSKPDRPPVETVSPDRPGSAVSVAPLKPKVASEGRETPLGEPAIGVGPPSTSAAAASHDHGAHAAGSSAEAQTPPAGMPIDPASADVMASYGKPGEEPPPVGSKRSPDG